MTACKSASSAGCPTQKAEGINSDISQTGNVVFAVRLSEIRDIQDVQFDEEATVIDFPLKLK